MPAGSNNVKGSISLRINRLQQWFRMTRGNLQAFKQANVSPRQLPALIRERAVWIQVIKNLYLIEGSWTGALKRLSLVMKGYPKKSF